MTSHCPQGNADKSRHTCPHSKPGHTPEGVRHPYLTTSPPHHYCYDEVPGLVPQPSSSLESTQSGWPSHNHVGGMQVPPSGQRSSPARHGWLLQLGRFLQPSMLSQEQGLSMGGGQCLSWLHGFPSGVQGESGPKCPHDRSQVLPTPHSLASLPFQDHTNSTCI